MMHPTLPCDNCGAVNQSQAVYCGSCGRYLEAGIPTIHRSVTGQLLAKSVLKQRYRIIAPIGKGGMGAVYKAEDTQLGNRQAALKELSQSGMNPQEQKQAADAFKQEATMLARLQHPNLPSIFDHFEENGRCYLAMSFIEGETLEDYLSHTQGGKLSLDKALPIGIQICMVLGYLHNQQPMPIIFRDLKPANIMRTPNGHIYLIDFGIARHFKPDQTKDTECFGSRGYAPPEQYGRAQTTPRSDIYSLGATLHQMLSGNDPSDTPFHFAPLQLHGQSPLLTELTALITSMLDMDAQKRPTSVAVVKQTLERAANQLLYPSQSPDILSTVPPSPPYNLQVRVGNPIVNLQWEPSSTHNVSYKIVRKTSSQPVSVNDGQLLATVPGCVYDDTQPEIGIPIFYAVFAAFGDITSTDAARLQRSVLLPGDVVNVDVQVADHFVELFWQAPSNAHNIVVVRKEKMPPSSLNDGKRLSLLDFSHVVDQDVQNDCLYYYTIYSQFKDYDGNIITTHGITKSATPEAPPEIISQLGISSTKLAQGYEVKLHWTSPSKGQAIILKSARAPSLKTGEIISKSDLARHGQLLEEDPGSLTERWTQSGIAYFTPIVLFQDKAYVGTPQRYAIIIDDVSDLHYQNLGNAIRLSWTWPVRCQEVVVVYDYKNWPQLHNTKLHMQKVMRVEYERQGYYDLRGAENCDHYIVVAAIFKQGNDSITSSGARIQARQASKIVVTYEITTSHSLFGPKKRLLHIHSHTQGILPTLLFVSRQGRLPINKGDGELVYRLEGPVSIRNNLQFELPDKPFGPNIFGRLFLEDDDKSEVVTIKNPSKDKLRLP